MRIWCVPTVVMASVVSVVRMTPGETTTGLPKPSRVLVVISKNSTVPPGFTAGAGPASRTVAWKVIGLLGIHGLFDDFGTTVLARVPLAMILTVAAPELVSKLASPL